MLHLDLRVSCHSSPSYLLVPHLPLGLTNILGPRHKLVQLIKSNYSLSGSLLATPKDTYTLLWL